ncbi:kinase-like domain-containing protein [Mycena crocata]|nr:kinase-like domain-containing protein [Mycena crocata]
MFDFYSYLALQLTLEPADFHVEVLTGGLTNKTVRATFSNPVQLFQSKLFFSSVVLKYAPPYVASDPFQAMSVHRQLIEANALSYLAQQPDIQGLLLNFPELKIPELIHHDTTFNVLWITDLGPTQTLSKFLSVSPADKTLCQIAATLGAFIARFWEVTAHPDSATTGLFTRPDEQENPVYFLTTTALTVMSQHGVSDAEILSARVGSTMQAKEKLEPCLGMVDFWPGSILIALDGSRGLVDWGYFGLSTPGAEIGMLVAHLHLLVSQTRGCEAARTFIASFLDSYGAHAPPVSPYFKRQALIAYGREMVTAIEFFATELDEEGKKRVLTAGVRSLRAAAGSESEMNSSAIRWENFLR